MAFIMIATGASSRSRVRTLSVRPLLLVALAGALALLATGSGLGYWLAMAPAPQPVVVAPPPVPASPYTLEQLGAISGRLFTLENRAAQLGERIGALKQGSPSVLPRETERRTSTPPRTSPGASGGPLLAPRPDAGYSGLPGRTALDAKLDLVEQQIATVAEAAGQHSHALMRLPSRWPVAGADLTGSFGNRVDPFARRNAFHEGLDFAAEAGTPIDAAAGGTVVFAGFKGDYGWMVEIDHGNGLASRYAHASRLLVRLGQVVVPGERIALVGSTGRSTGPHLHFEILQARAAVDPKRFLGGS